MHKRQLKLETGPSQGSVVNTRILKEALTGYSTSPKVRSEREKKDKDG